MSGDGYSECPETFKKAVMRGNIITGAAWRQGRDKTFVFAIQAALAAGIKEERAKNDFQKKFGKNYAIGKSLQDCSKFTYMQVCESNTNFLTYFRQQDFDVIRPSPTNAIVPVHSIEASETGPSSPSLSMGGSDSISASSLALALGGRVCNYTVLGLERGASLPDIKKAASTLMKLYHPDKGHGDTERFIQVREALMALTGLSEDVQGERQLAWSPATTAKSLQDMTVGELEDQYQKYNTSGHQIRALDERNRLMFSKVGSLLVTAREKENRPRAVEMTRQFRMSAKYWDIAQLKAWFQPNRFKFVVDRPNDWEQKLEAQYGPYLRKGNEDLDPFMIYEKLWTRGRFVHKKELQILVGLDRVDAVDHGKTLIVPLATLWEGGIHYKRMAQVGFDVKLADEMLAANAWMELYKAKMIEDPHLGVSIDLQTAWQQYSNIKFVTDPHGAESLGVRDESEFLERQERKQARELQKEAEAMDS